MYLLLKTRVENEVRIIIAKNNHFRLNYLYDNHCYRLCLFYISLYLAWKNTEIE